MTFGQRFLLTLFIVIVFLLVIAAFGYFGGRWDVLAEAQKQAPVLKPNLWDGEIITLDRVALDSAYRAQMGILFATWLRDPQYGPERAKIGARWARQAYIDVREALDKREAEFSARFGFVEKQCK